MKGERAVIATATAHHSVSFPVSNNWTQKEDWAYLRIKRAATLTLFLDDLVTVLQSRRLESKQAWVLTHWIHWYEPLVLCILLQRCIATSLPRAVAMLDHHNSFSNVTRDNNGPVCNDVSSVENTIHLDAGADLVTEWRSQQHQKKKKIETYVGLTISWPVSLQWARAWLWAAMVSVERDGWCYRIKRLLLIYVNINAALPCSKGQFWV